MSVNVSSFAVTISMAFLHWSGDEKIVIIRSYRDELVLEKFKREDNGRDGAQLRGPVDCPCA